MGRRSCRRWGKVIVAQQMMVFPGVRAMRTASALNSGENVRRVRGGLDDFFMDTSIMTGEGGGRSPQNRVSSNCSRSRPMFQHAQDYFEAKGRGGWR